MWLVDLFSSYLYGLKFIALAVCVLILVSSIDDLLIDAVYWMRRLRRALTVYREHRPLGYQALYEPAEKPLAVMVPAWHETGVIGRMAELAASTLDYENYHIFVGTYPNDPDTQRDVDEVCARFPNVHKVVCARPGPTSKADCLNNVLDAILQFEQRANVEFAGFVLHDAEDVISPLELRLFNYLVARKDLIQLPVYPFEKSWRNFTCLHYLDEFAEIHGKDILVREAIAGQVPSAGVGTCFSRRAVLALLADGDGIAFDVQSLTEDYDIGFRLKQKGMSEIFVRFPVVSDPQSATVFGASRRESSVICVREYFPDTAEAAIRQKSRWIIGIVFQGFRTHKWSGDWLLNYFLWRDRKGAIGNFVSFAAMIIFLQLLAVWLYQQLWPDAYRFLSIFEGDAWLMFLLYANLLLMTNRIVQRMFFVSSYYGLWQGVLSVPRIFWGNYINFMANWRAIRQIIEQGSPRRVAWEKTMHEFPSVGGENRARRPLGSILIEQGVLTAAQLDAALQHKSRGLKLGSWLVHEGTVTPEQLAAGLAAQSHLAWETIDPHAIAPALLATIPAPVALHYAVLPIRNEGRTLVVACESDLDPVSTAALARKIGRPVRCVIVPKGQVTVGLRYWHARRSVADPRQQLETAVHAGRIDRTCADRLWRHFVSRQVLLAEILMSLGHIDGAALKSLLLRHERSHSSLGDFLVGEGVISRQTLDDALNLQRTLQPAIGELIDAAAGALPA
ncbi:MAG: cyclic di-3',5'-guanylate-activated glycosyltransferase NrfB [Pseudomonadota bacterium]